VQIDQNLLNPEALANVQPDLKQRNTTHGQQTLWSRIGQRPQAGTIAGSK
jgi:hypothetical protein